MSCAWCARALSLPDSPPGVEREYRWLFPEDNGWMRLAEFLDAVPPPTGCAVTATGTRIQGNIYLDSPDYTLAASGVSLSIVLCRQPSGAGQGRGRHERRRPVVRQCRPRTDMARHCRPDRAADT